MNEDFADINALSFEDALSKLQEITNKLEKGNIMLEDAVQFYVYACRLQAHCRQKLESAHRQIDVVLSNKDGVAIGVDNISTDGSMDGVESK